MTTMSREELMIVIRCDYLMEAEVSNNAEYIEELFVLEAHFENMSKSDMEDFINSDEYLKL